MNWKKHFEEMKVGDKVRIIKPCSKCNGSSDTRYCFNDNYKNKIGIIKDIDKIHIDGRTHHVIISSSKHCYFDPKVLEKVE